MGRILAIDYGRKRVGLAVTDPLQLIPGGLCTVAAHEALDYVVKYCQKEKVDRILLGLPKQMDYTASESMQYIEPFLTALKRKLPEMNIEWVDERFTSVLAHKAMLDGGLKKKDRQNKALVDEISAVIILQTWMESNR
ncbi:MAG: Holliday junction resolvase RuvX [Bacteroidales bacterium]|jgi:putative Holliday junction resolvase|nr:Holliday junction resolvase RuvX [Bacteroidales bacterium]MDD4771263.1 Holliday junction resolvase RuvX [Bacteroidales bacterium]HKL93227.1 Holliday junction resolvase RuvX [Bacteroidales bacterium]